MPKIESFSTAVEPDMILTLVGNIEEAQWVLGSSIEDLENLVECYVEDGREPPHKEKTLLEELLTMRELLEEMKRTPWIQEQAKKEQAWVDHEEDLADAASY